jgi:outer membrane lipopolysaccharide assembly protein LptE/RlpB
MQLSSLLPRPVRFLAAAAALLLPGCAGYHTGSDKPGRMEHVKTLAVPTFKNLTLEPRSAVLVTNNVVRQFQLDGTYQIKDSQDADAVLHGTIREFTRRQLRSARNNNLRTRELELIMFVDYTVEEPVTGSVLTRGTVNGSTSVFLDPNFQLSERQAIDDASRKMAEELVSRLAEGWGASELPIDEGKPAAAAKAKRQKAAERSILPPSMR